MARAALWLLCCLICLPLWAGEADLSYAEGLQLLKQGFNAEAAVALERSVRQQPLAASLFALGVSYSRLHRQSQAYQAYQQALSLLPDPALGARIRGGLGDVYFELGDFASAAEAYRQALDFQTSWDGVRLKLATTYLRLGRFSEALRESETLLQSPIPASEARYLRSLIYLARHQWSEATQELEALAAEGEHRFEAYMQLNWLYRLQQNYPQADRVARKAVKHFGTQQPQAYQLAVSTLLEKLTLCLPTGCELQPDLELARSYLERWLLIAPDQPQSYYQLGQLEQLSGDYASAREAYLRAYEGFSERPDYLLKLAEMDWSLGKRSQARAWLQKLPVLDLNSGLGRELAKWPEFASFLQSANHQDTPLWQNYLESWLRLNPRSNEQAEAQILQGLKLWRAGQTAWALPLFEQAHLQAPQWWLPCELSGRLLLSSNPAAALPWLQAAVRLNPMSQELTLLWLQYLPAGEQRNRILQQALQTFPESSELQELFLREQTGKKS